MNWQKQLIAAKKSLVTQEMLREMFRYEPETGRFIRLTSVGGQLPGSVAGYFSQDGYRRIHINRIAYPSSWLAVLYMTGEWPEHEVDHKNLDPADDRWENLRPATGALNCINKEVRADNTLGVKGIRVRTWARKGQTITRYEARGWVNGRTVSLGWFYDIEEAIAARLAVYSREYGEFAR